jgi:hypothetical protein
MALGMPSQKISSPGQREEEPELRLLLGEDLTPPPLWRSLRDNLRERLFPQKLPPLELTSQPVAVPETWERDRYQRRSAAISFVLHAAGLGVLLALSWMGAQRIVATPPKTAVAEGKHARRRRRRRRRS